ncbi:MAG: TasA family protein [Christensenellales bacterium]|jgi:predicted ribosomally synthesized peptide with SipW-like signal peptide
MSKKIIAVAAAIILAAIGIVGGTLAWFTDEKEVTNVLTTGNIEISLSETITEFPVIMPGALVEKDPTITNISGNDQQAYIRASFQLFDDNDEALDDANIIKAINDAILNPLDENGDPAGSSNWIKDTGTGWYYYTGELDVGAENAITFFERIKFDGETFDNKYKDLTFKVKIFVQATQVANQSVPAYTPAEFKKLGWPKD